MSSSVDIVRKAFEHKPTGHLPKGELWIGLDLLRKANLADDLKGHIDLVERLRQDVLCLPLSDGISMKQDLGYRRFSLKELEEASRVKHFFLMVVMNGPFQRLGEKIGLKEILKGWKRERHEMAKEYEKEGIEVGILIEQCLERSVDAIVIADDLAGESSTFVDPHEIEDLFSSFYIQAVSKIHREHSHAMFHSCGNIKGLIPQLLSFGFDGLAASEHRINDLIGLKEKYKSNLTLMAGIDAEILGAGEMSLLDLKEFERQLKSLASQGGFILCSSSGLFSGEFLEKIEELYRIADKLFDRF